MPEIEVVKSYRVGNELFNSKEEAERYLVEQEKLSLLNNLTYKESEFHDTSYYEHYIYQGGEHEFRICVGRFTTLCSITNILSTFFN